MDDMQPIDMRRRIRELLSIPERDRSDAEWDELNELEIRTAPGNRDYDRSQERQGDRRPSLTLGPGRRPDRNGKPQGAKNGNLLRPQSESRPEGGGRLLKRQHRRPKRPGEVMMNIEHEQNSAQPIIVDLSSGNEGSEE
jgi:hypothetical protein